MWSRHNPPHISPNIIQPSQKASGRCGREKKRRPIVEALTIQHGACVLPSVPRGPPCRSCPFSGPFYPLGWARRGWDGDWDPRWDCKTDRKQECERKDTAPARLFSLHFSPPNRVFRKKENVFLSAKILIIKMTHWKIVLDEKMLLKIWYLVGFFVFFLIFWNEKSKFRMGQFESKKHLSQWLAG